MLDRIFCTLCVSKYFVGLVCWLFCLKQGFRWTVQTNSLKGKRWFGPDNKHEHNDACCKHSQNPKNTAQYPQYH